LQACETTKDGVDVTENGRGSRIILNLGENFPGLLFFKQNGLFRERVANVTNTVDVQEFAKPTARTQNLGRVQ